MKRDDLEDVLDSMSQLASLDEMRGLLLEIREACGFANLVYHASRIPGCDLPNPILLLSYDPAWVQRYVAENYFEIDPVIEQSFSGTLAVDWSELDMSRSSARHLFKEAESYGVGRSGVTIPIRGPNGERALFTATSNLSQREWEERKQGYIRNCHLIAHFFHARAVYLSGFRKDVPKLSSRERQCMKLVADGLQAKVISHELGISESAVRLYTRSARHKLRCGTLAEGAVKATQLELI
jgi:DNA-binding CsgD family transcriptional regulator